MGLFSKVFSKEACELCGKESGILSRAKLKDGKYVCTDCTKNASSFYHEVRYTLDEFKKHLEYMERENELYEKAFATLPAEKKDIQIRNFSNGIIFADDIGMFEIVNAKTKAKNKKELFRYDQIWDFKTYTKPAPEGSNYKYSEVGIKIKMLSEADEDPEYVLASDYIKSLRHPYIREELEIVCAKNTNNIEYGNVKRHLEMIMGLVLETKFTTQFNNADKPNYRHLGEVEKTFNRGPYTDKANEAEILALGKPLKEFK